MNQMLVKAPAGKLYSAGQQLRALAGHKAAQAWAGSLALC